MSRVAAKSSTTPKRTRPATTLPLRRRPISSLSVMISRAYGISTWPSAVRSSPFVERSNSVTPTSPSSLRICMLTAACVRFSDPAAPLTVPTSATVRKARSR